MGLFTAAPEQCYFCGSAVGPPSRTRLAWSCSACGCWNGRDRAGQIDGDHPAMRDSAMNEASFARRAHPSSARLPTASSAASPFCHTCQANQTLVLNLLATYLPAESDPTYAERVAGFEAYRTSLNERYPQVCAACQPGVDAWLKRADQRAQAEAFGSALRRSVDTTRRSGPSWIDVGVWRVRSLAWALDMFAVIGIALSGWAAPNVLFRAFQSHTTAVLAVRLCAILWAVWDPTWLHAARERRPAHGRRVWVGTMLGLYVLRLAIASGIIWGLPASWITAAAALDITIVIAALTRRRDTSRIQLTLVRPVRIEAHSQTLPSSQHPSTALHHPAPSLSHSQASPQRSRPSAVFGQPSLALPERSDEPMDWEPTHSDWDGFGVGTQRMFAAAESNETGLEALLATWGLGGEPVRERPQAAWGRYERGRWGEQRKQGSGGVFAIPQPSTPPDVLRPLRDSRIVLVMLRVAALLAVLTGLPTEIALKALLGLEVAASTVMLGAALPSRSWWLALYALDAGVRAVVLFLPSVTPLPEALRAQAPAIECVVWALLDAALLLT
ncbi:hypothetical protein CC85DRAFT_314239 [Cutaneotrichosporon oleaginosum]|uniref:Ima1 N-terminal domain-containing protein n=1 Tax=Cutaneotrichosporon oleaginosum TaxID=879819 RepID=A0A0J0XCH6_9TREE|nr:uncharacterized protein CC85DRAFT_314239 [Cutaneotrichosporon oleaginosum]KLT38775.1 hypothetical protein CC85DRAFT_314239 [Cutaneotrichosporon oleaginosum]TXT11501.1 hypothetical protein COLE_01911 [Cutaneotrichosporon oleaginosum]